MSDMAISVKSLSKVYKLYNQHIDRLKEALHPFKKKYHRPFYALKNITLEIKKGETLGIVGRNGAGKSTLLKIISGVLTPTRGSCNVNGTISALLELGTGFNPDLTGMENIYLNGTIKGFTKKEMDSKLDNIISFAEIDDFISQPLKTYSNGMRARLGFALVINMDPEILILDEVLAVGDELFKRKCYAKMEEFFNSGSTVLFVSHSINTINEICSRVILLDKGEQILEGPPKFVTMYYQKLLFAQPRESKKIREEIVKLDNDEDKKKEFSENEEKIETEMKENTPGILIEPRQKPFFMPGFESKSLVEQKYYDVEIKDIEVKTLDGKKVNSLVMDENYIYSYTVQFNLDVENVFFTMALKNEKGLNVSSATTKETGIIQKIQKGKTYLVQWYFMCNLLPGNYFTNIGVFNISPSQEVVVLNRIADASAFKVQKIPNLRFGGLVHLNQDVKIEIVN